MPPHKRILPDRLKREFDRKQVVCVEYQDIHDDDEREVFKVRLPFLVLNLPKALFQRVQLGMALTPAEKLQVLNTPRSKFVRDLVYTHITNPEGGLNSNNLEWDPSRGSDFRCIASSLWCFDKWLDGQLKVVPSVPQLEKWLDDESEVDEDFAANARETFEIFSYLVKDDKLRKVFTKNYNAKSDAKSKISPVEFVLIPLFIFAKKDDISMQELSAGIGKLRQDVRKHHTDIRLNSKVSRSIIDYIRGYKAQKNGKVESASTTIDKFLNGDAAASDNKRKRPNGDEDSDDAMDTDEDDAPKAKRKTSKKKQKAVEQREPSPPSEPVQPSKRVAAIRAKMGAQPGSPAQYSTPTTSGGSTSRTHSVQQGQMQGGSSGYK